MQAGESYCECVYASLRAESGRQGEDGVWELLPFPGYSLGKLDADFLIPGTTGVATLDETHLICFSWALWIF